MADLVSAAALNARRQPISHVVLSPRSAAAIFLLSSVGLWALIWLAARWAASVLS